MSYPAASTTNKFYQVISCKPYEVIQYEVITDLNMSKVCQGTSIVSGTGTGITGITGVTGITGITGTSDS